MANAQLTKHSFRSIARARPRFLGFILEQATEIYREVSREVPNAMIVNLRDFSQELMSDRYRLIASDVQLQLPSFREVDRPTMAERFGRKYGMPDGRGIQINCWYSVRTTQEPGFCYTSAGIRLGPHYSALKTMQFADEEIAFGSAGLIKWPEDSSDAYRRRLLAQCLPAPSARELLLAHYCAKPDDAEHLSGPLSEDLFCLIQEPECLLRKLHGNADPDGMECFINVRDHCDIRWLDEKQTLSIVSSPDWRDVCRSSSMQSPEYRENDSTAATAAESSHPEGSPTVEMPLDRSTEVGAEHAVETESNSTRSLVVRESTSVLNKTRGINLPNTGRVSGPEDAEGSPVESSDFVPCRGRRKWIRQSYQDRCRVPWDKSDMDANGNPIALMPPHLQNSSDAYLVRQPTEEDLSKALEMMRVTQHEDLDEEEKLLFRHLVAHGWSLFDDILRPVGGEPVSLQLLNPQQKPIALQPYALSEAKLECLRAQLEEWLRDGVITPSKSPWSFPCLMLQKKGAQAGTSNAFRLAVDFRRLNTLIDGDAYPSPDLETCLSFLAGKKYLSSLDVRWGFHNVPLSGQAMPNSRYSTQDLVTFTSPLGSYSFLRLPLGIKPATAIFSRELNSTLREWLYRDLVTFADDVTMAHHDKIKHIQVLVDVVDRLAGRGYSVRPSKCDFLAKALNFLGHVCTQWGFKPSPRCIHMILEAREPTRMQLVGQRDVSEYRMSPIIAESANKFPNRFLHVQITVRVVFKIPALTRGLEISLVDSICALIERGHRLESDAHF